jgi:hypothetical protein
VIVTVFDPNNSDVHLISRFIVKENGEGGVVWEDAG